MNTINPDQLLAQMRVMAAQARSESAAPAGEAGAPDFADLLKQSVDKVNDMQQQAGQLATAFEKGDPNVDLAEVMVALQKAGVSFQAMVQVRNRLVSAYQDIMNMQV
jgi:flagellar hook-basal body complex protein FliE